jgi:methyltransferase (TIGR00027 family)
MTHKTPPGGMRNAPSYVKPLLAEPDAFDLELHSRNCSSTLATSRLRELVPLLEFVDCVVEEIGPERTVLSLPLLASAMNQNGTHQAAIFYLVADYALGVGMFGVLPGVYVTGVHDRCEALPVQYWLKRGTVQHLAPGTGTLRAVVEIPPESAATMRRQLRERGRTELTERVRFFQEGQLVAESEHCMGLYADVPRVAGTRANIFQVQNTKTSALMIAGLRPDAISQQVAGDQGRAIAQRMALVAPQLPALVDARSKDVEAFILEHASAATQVLVLAIGLDPKPVLLAATTHRWFGVDLRDMLKDREHRFAKAGAMTTSLTLVPADLRLEGWDAQLVAAGLDQHQPTLVIIEGLSMYLSAEETAAMLRVLGGLLTSPGSRIWIDHVTPDLFDLDLPEVQSFLASIARLGEPFITGVTDATQFASDTWRTFSSRAAAELIDDSDPVHGQYRFSVLAPTPGGAPQATVSASPN